MEAIKVQEKPIPFNSEMVNAILDGRKTQTRRVITPKPGENIVGFQSWIHQDKQLWTEQIHTSDPLHNKLGKDYKCPYGQPGSQLWVRETWATSLSLDSMSPSDIGIAARRAGYNSKESPKSDLWYMADMHYRQWGSEKTSLGKSRPSIHMPRWASRIQLEITDVRVERLQEITEADVCAEMGRDGWIRDGLWALPNWEGGPFDSAQKMFAHLWDSIYKDRGFGWEANPFVWVVEFKKV